VYLGAIDRDPLCFPFLNVAIGSEAVDCITVNVPINNIARLIT